MARQVQGDLEQEKKEIEDSFQRMSEQAHRKVNEGSRISVVMFMGWWVERGKFQLSEVPSGMKVRDVLAGWEYNMNILWHFSCRHWSTLKFWIH